MENRFTSREAGKGSQDRVPFQLFISYARNDDKAPPLSAGGKGFVTALRDQLDFEFTNLGGEVPQTWWDRRAIEPHEQFDPVIQEGIDGSELLLVVLSRNWLARPWCQRELELFARHWQSESERPLRERIWVVSKQYIDPQSRPSLLQGQSSYEFFFREKSAREGDEQEYFRQGKPQEGYHEIVKRLAVNLWRRAQPRTEKPPAEAPLRKPVTVTQEPRRTIYVAKPARDMRSAYLRIVNELGGRNYAVTPAPDENVPLEDALGFVDAALERSEASIHLLGENLGGLDGSLPIVKMQLERAAKRAAKNDSFKRIIWAPKVMVDEDGHAVGECERDPLAVVEECGKQLDSDKIDGSELSAFVDFILQHLERIVQAPKVAEHHDKQIAAGASVYVEFAEKDVDYGLECMEALQQREVYTEAPAFDKTEPARTRAINRKKLRDCDAVFLCWKDAPDNWVDWKEEELKDVSKLRSKPFALSALVVGPPPDDASKKVHLRKKSRAIDIALDLTKYPSLPPEALDPLIDKAQSAATPQTE